MCMSTGMHTFSGTRFLMGKELVLLLPSCSSFSGWMPPLKLNFMLSCLPFYLLSLIPACLRVLR